jgi:hypothetical protein
VLLSSAALLLLGGLAMPARRAERGGVV